MIAGNFNKILLTVALFYDIISFCIKPTQTNCTSFNMIDPKCFILKIDITNTQTHSKYFIPENLFHDSQI